MRGRRHIFVPLLLLVLFLAYQASITVFTHVHIVNGVMIVHSHPSSGKHHTHTAGQVISIAHLSVIQTLEAVTSVVAEAVCLVLYVLEFQADTYRAKAPHTRCVHLRAPPFHC